jgi:hypothetical protein
MEFGSLWGVEIIRFTLMSNVALVLSAVIIGTGF